MTFTVRMREVYCKEKKLKATAILCSRQSMISHYEISCSKEVIKAIDDFTL